MYSSSDGSIKEALRTVHCIVRPHFWAYLIAGRPVQVYTYRMEDGLYYNLSFDEYRQIDAINQSALTRGTKSAAHMKAYLEGGNEPTNKKALLIGSLCHTAVLEPHLLDHQFAVLPKVDKRTRQGKEVMEDFHKIHGHKMAVTQEEMDQALAISESVHAHPAAAKWLQDGSPEVTAVWTAPNGVRCKGRIDWLPKVKGNTKHRLVDLKTTTDASPRFAKSVAAYDYHLQAAFYLEGYRALTGKDAEFVFIAVEKEPPYAVGVYTLDLLALDYGRERFMDSLMLYKEARDSGEWKGYSDEARVLSLPSWATT